MSLGDRSCRDKQGPLNSIKECYWDGQLNERNRRALLSFPTNLHRAEASLLHSGRGDCPGGRALAWPQGASAVGSAHGGHLPSHRASSDLLLSSEVWRGPPLVEGEHRELGTGLFPPGHRVPAAGLGNHRCLLSRLRLLSS